MVHCDLGVRCHPRRGCAGQGFALRGNWLPPYCRPGTWLHYYFRYKAYRVDREDGVCWLLGRWRSRLLPPLPPQWGTISAVHHGWADCLLVDTFHCHWLMSW